MTLRRFWAPLLFLAPTLAFGASREMQELQRDVGLLQEQVRSLQRAQDEKLAGLTVLIQQTLDAANKANTAVAVIQSTVQQSLRDQEGKVAGPVVSMGARMDQMASDFRTLQQSVADVTAMLGKMQAQLTDVSNAVKVMQSPAQAPPPPSGVGAGAGQSDSAPPMPAAELYANARRDQTTGKYDLALAEFADYLKWYGKTDYAPNAQYFIGEIHYNKADYQSSLQEFDSVLEKYPDNNKTPDALYMKGLSLMKLGRKTDGATEFKELIKRYPNNDLSKKACQQLTTLGLRCAAPRSAATKAGASKARRKN